MPPKMKFDYKLLKNMCDEGNVKLLVDYENAFITRDTRIIGKCICCENNFISITSSIYIGCIGTRIILCSTC